MQLGVEGCKPAGQRPGSSIERSFRQRTALTLNTVGVFPMTHHVESDGNENWGGAPALVHARLGWHSAQPSRRAALIPQVFGQNTASDRF